MLTGLARQHGSLSLLLCLLNFGIASTSPKANPCHKPCNEILSLVLSRYDVDIWGPMAERVAEQVPKGSNVCVQGKLNPASWTDREGKKQTKWKVCCATMPTLLRQVERSTAYVACCSTYKALTELWLTPTAPVSRHLACVICWLLHQNPQSQKQILSSTCCADHCY